MFLWIILLKVVLDIMANSTSVKAQIVVVLILLKSKSCSPKVSNYFNLHTRLWYFDETIKYIN